MPTHQRKPRKPAPGVLSLTAAAVTLTAAAGEGEQRQRRFSMVAYTGEPLQQFWADRPIVVDLDTVTQASARLPILYDHWAGVENVVGQSEGLSVEGGRLVAEGPMFTTDIAKKITALADEGFAWQASIGADIGKREDIDAGAKVVVNGREHTGPVSVARNVVLREISFVVLGADPKTSALVANRIRGIAMSFEEWLTSLGYTAEEQGALDEVKMANLKKLFEDSGIGTAEEETPAPADPAATAADDDSQPDPAPPDDQEAARARAADRAIKARRKAEAAEVRRIAAIRKLCAGGPTMTVGTGANRQTVSVEAHAIEQGWTPERVELEILRATRPTGPGIIVRNHDRDASLQALTGALILRANGRLDHRSYNGRFVGHTALPSWLRAGINSDQRQRVMENAHRYSSLSAFDLCREALRIDGKDLPVGREETIRAAVSGSALTNIFTDSVNAILLATYDEAPDTTMGWVSEADVNDFKTQERPRMAKGPNLAKLPRGGEADHYRRSDLVETYKIARYAKQFVVDEQDIIDDMLNALATTPQEMGLAAARLRPDLVYAILLSNDALGADSVALFHSSHANLNTTQPLSSANLIESIAAVEKQQESSVNLNLRVSHVIVPSDLKHTGAELINSSTIVTGSDVVRGSMNTINSIESLALVSDARLSNGLTDPADGDSLSGSTTTWYLASAMGHTIEVGYLRGSGRAPQTTSWRKNGEDGQFIMGWTVKLDIGAKALDYRALQKNTAS